jgi:hypothetical protein
MPSTAKAERTWARRFASRVGQHRDVTEVELPPVEPVVAASLAVFQLGESGTGEHLLAAAHRAETDDDHVTALGHFVAEEQEHARMLQVVLDTWGWPLRTSHWSDRIFVAIRRAHSLRTEVLVLMVAEVVALTYYSALRDGIGVAALRDVFARIHADEVLHVDFHCQTLPPHLRRFPPLVRAVARLLWSVLVTGASVAVAASHRRALRHVGMSPWTFVRRVAADRRHVSRRLFD